MVEVGDKFIFHSTNGTNYDIEVIDINLYYNPSMKYVINIDDYCEKHIGFLLFVGDDFLNKCEKVN